jgi:hypothetical protein
MIPRLKPMVYRLAGLSVFWLVVSGIGLSQGPAKDPGVRGGPPSAGTSFSDLSTELTQLFQRRRREVRQNRYRRRRWLGPAHELQ